MKQKRVPTSDRGRMDASLRDFLEDLDGMVNLWRDAEDTQWLKSQSRASGVDPGVKQRGGLSDPTGDTVADPRRLAVRGQRKRCLTEMAAMAEKMGNMRSDLEKAVTAWGN